MGELLDRRDILRQRLARPGLEDALRQRLLAEIQRLDDADPTVPCAHVLDWRARLRAATEAAVPHSTPVPRERRTEPRILKVRTLDNPDLTAGLVEGKELGENSATETVDLPVNLATVIGGFALVEGAEAEHVAAIAMYRQAWLVLSGADTGAGGVWSGGDGEEARLARLLDAGARYRKAQRVLGMIEARLVEAVCCDMRSLREAARIFEGSDGGAARERIEARLLAAADLLAREVFGTVPGAGARRRLRAAGERPGVVTAEGYAKPWDDVREAS